MAINQFGEFERPLRNIRFSVDGLSLEMRLIPERVLQESHKPDEQDSDSVKRLTRGASEILEGDRCLRLRFPFFLAIAVDTDIDVDLFGGLHADWRSAPRIKGRSSFYPLLEIVGSNWKQKLPDFRGRESNNIRHIRAISAECSLDILGEIGAGVWENNY
ncbi:MAG: hypothetical protein AAFQ22_11235 [Pseudomonadota bacterium]